MSTDAGIKHVANFSSSSAGRDTLISDCTYKVQHTVPRVTNTNRLVDAHQGEIEAPDAAQTPILLPTTMLPPPPPASAQNIASRTQYASWDLSRTWPPRPYLPAATLEPSNKYN